MSARIVIAAVVIAGVVVGAGALAFLALSDPPAPVDEGERPLRTTSAPEDGAVPDDVRPREGVELAPVPADGGPWVELEGWEDVQRAIDWHEVGKIQAELVPLLVSKARHLERDEDIPASEIARVEELRTRIDGLLERVGDRAPHLAANGLLLHPAVLANAAAATLHERGAGVTPEQLEQFRALANEALMDTEYLQNSAADTEAPPLFGRIVEGQVRRGHCDRLTDVLDRNQRRALRPERIEGRVGLDSFGGVEVFRDDVIVIRYETTDELAEAITALVIAEVPVDDPMRAIGVDMMRTLMEIPRESPFPLGVRNADRAGHVLLDTITMSLQHSMELVGHLVRAFSENNPPPAPPEVLRRPIILIREQQD